MDDNQRRRLGESGSGDDQSESKPMICPRCGCRHMERSYYSGGMDALKCRNCFSIVAIVKSNRGFI